MNTATVKGLLVFMIGAASGALVTWKYLKDKHQEEIDELCEQVIEEVEAYKKSLAAFPDDLMKGAVKNYSSGILAPDEMVTKEERIPIVYNKPSLTSLLEKQVIYNISCDEFNNSMPDYDKISLCWFEHDSVLVDEDDEVITNINAIIGGVDLLTFGENTEDPDIVYIRNGIMSSDYEVARLPKSYQETVLGITPDEPPRKKARNGKANKDE